MKKLNFSRQTVVYWIATLWLSLGMISTAIVQLIKEAETVAFMTDAGYPLYFLTMLGIGKILGTIVILVPGLPLIKEWAYAGFFFVVAGAAFTYVSIGRPDDLYHLGLMLALIIVSWYTRPESRKLA